MDAGKQTADQMGGNPTYGQNEPQGKVVKDADLSGAKVKVEEVAVTEDTWEEFYHEGSKRPSYRLLAGKGTVLPKAYVESMGVDVPTGDRGTTAVHDQDNDSLEQQTAGISRPVDEKAAEKSKKTNVTDAKDKNTAGVSQGSKPSSVPAQR